MSHEASTVHDDQSVEELRRELAAKREQQAATSEILRIIGESRTDIQAVFDTIITSAVRLCSARMGAVFRFDGELVHFAAQHNYPPRAIENLRRMYPRRPQADQASGRAILARSVAQIEDLLADQFYHREQALAGDWRSVLAVPMLREGVPIGAIVIARSEVGSFPDGHIELLKTFANHAVIAIENTRLFEEVQARTNELTEALEQQTATSELLKVIGRSAVDLQPVFEALAESAVRLCKAERSLIWRPEDDRLRLAASYNATAELIAFMERNPPPLLRSTASGRASLERRTIHIEDVLADPEYTYGSTQVDRVRTVLAIPMLKGDELLGVIVIYRHEVLPFTTSQIALMKTFADQAVIAIENTRLFEEVQARTRELAKTVEDLEIASQHKSQFVANMSHELRTPLAAILGYAELMQEGFYEPQGPKSLDALARIRSNGKHLLGLINTVLDIAKIESGQFTLNMGEYAIESVVETVRSATESLAQNKKLALTTEVAKSLPIGIGDEQRLTQVLLNLVGNAIKFTDTGEVRVTAKAINGRFNVGVTIQGQAFPKSI